MSYSPTPASGDNNNMFPQETSQRHRAPLSITTSFGQDWMSVSPFSSSPSTPQLYSQHHSPCMSHVSSATDDSFALGNFVLDSFDHATASAFDQRPLDMDGRAYLATQFEPLTKDNSAFTHGSFEHSKSQLAMQDLEFYKFMTSLNSSAYTI